MARLVDQVLASSQYCDSETTALAGCVCCGVTHPGGESRCHNCCAPMELSDTVRARGLPPQFVPVLGASGAGKTVYLGTLLDILNNGTHRVRGVANGTFSIAVQQDTMSALECRRFPEKTASEADGWQWVHCEVHWKKNRNRFVDLVTPDFAGEAIAQEIEEPGTYAAIRSIVARAHGMLVLCDAFAARNSPLQEDLFTMKLISYVAATRQDAKRSQKKKRLLDFPVALVLTKCDQCAEVRDDPAGFAASHLSRLHQFCQRNLSRYRFFAASVVGCCASLIDDYGCRSQIAWHVEPRGVIEPLEWIMQSNQRAM